MLVLNVRLFDHNDEVHPVLAGSAGRDDDLLLELVFVVVYLVGRDLLAAGHRVEHVVEDAFDLHCCHLSAVLADAHVVGLLAFGRCPSGDGDLLGQSVFEHYAAQVFKLCLGVEGAVHLEVPVEGGLAVGEVDVGGFDDALGLVVVDGRDGDVAADVDPRRGVVDAVGDEDRGEGDGFVLYLVGEFGFVVGGRCLVSDRSQRDASGFHTGFEIQFVGVGESSAIFIVDGYAFAIDVFALEGYGVEGDGAAFPREDGLDEECGAFVEILFGEGTDEFNHDLVVASLYGVGGGLVAHLFAVGFHFRQTAATDKEKRHQEYGED